MVGLKDSQLLFLSFFREFEGVWLTCFKDKLCVCDRTLIFIVCLGKKRWVAYDKLMIFFIFFPEIRIWHFMQIISDGDVVCSKFHSESQSVKLLWRMFGYKFIPEHCNHIYPGPSCSKLTMSLVNDTLKFTLSVTQILWNFLLKKCE